MLKKVAVMYKNKDDSWKKDEIDRTLELLELNNIKFDEYVGFNPYDYLPKAIKKDLTEDEVSLAVINGDTFLWFNLDEDAITSFNDKNVSGEFDVDEEGLTLRDKIKLFFS